VAFAMPSRSDDDKGGDTGFSFGVPAPVAPSTAGSSSDGAAPSPETLLPPTAVHLLRPTRQAPAPPTAESIRRRGATAPLPPACVGNGGSPSQRRAALEFLTRELRSLELEANQTAKLEQHVEVLQAQLKRAEQTANMYMRRCQMLEDTLQRERSGKIAAPADSGGGSGGSVSLAEAATRLPTMDPVNGGTAPISLGAAAGMLPPPPSFIPPPDFSSTPGAAEDEDDIDALIAAQRDLPVPAARRSTALRSPLRLRPDT